MPYSPIAASSVARPANEDDNAASMRSGVVLSRSARPSSATARPAGWRRPGAPGLESRRGARASRMRFSRRSSGRRPRPADTAGTVVLRSRSSLRLCSASRTTPTISISSCLVIARTPRQVRRQRTTAPRLNFRTNASLTMATFGRSVDVRPRELPPGQQIDPDRAEIVGADHRHIHVGIGVRSRLEAFDRHVARRVRVREQRVRGRGRRRDAGDCPKVVLDAIEERQQTSRACSR